MKTVVTFTGNKVYVLCGDGNKERITIEKIIPVQFSENCVINGSITDSGVFGEGIKAVWEQHSLPKNGVILSVDGNHIRTKLMKTPKLTEKKLGEIISYEFRETNEAAESFSSYVVMSKDKNELSILALNAERSYILSVAQIFFELGIKLESMTASRCGIINILSYIQSVKGRNCVILSLEAEILSTILVEQGGYVSFSSAHIYSDHGTRSFGTEVARTVSQMQQFQSTMRSENLITDAFCLGFSEDDYNMSSAQVASLGLGVSVLGESPQISINGGTIADCFNHAGVFVLSKKEGNLYNSIISRQDKIKKRDRFLLKLLPVLVIVAVMAIVSSIFITSNIQKQKEIDRLNAYLEDAGNIKAQEDYNFYIAESARLNGQKASAESMKEAIASYPRAVSSLNATIASCGEGIVDVVINSYDAASGSLGFSATGQNAEKLNEFIKALTDTGLFYNVSYSGYSLMNDTGAYNVNVSCTLSGEAGK